MALGRWGWIVLIDTLGGIVGAILDISGQVGFPTWIWVSLLAGGLPVASFFAFHRVRLQRDKAMQLLDSGIATRIITVENYDYEFQKKGNQLILRLNPEIHATPGVRVEDIEVEIRGRRYDTDWEPMKKTVSGDIGHYVYAELPKLKRGKYQARVIAHIDNKEWPSPPFTVEYKVSQPTKKSEKGKS